MTPLTLYAHPKCSTCEAARAWLRRHGQVFAEKDIRTTPPTVAELRTLLQAQDGKLSKVCNTSGIEYRAQGLAARLPQLTEAGALELVASNGMFVKRPVLLGPGLALAGFKEPRWAAALLRP